MNQTKKVVLLTGATGGLGTAIAAHLDKNLFKVYGAGRKNIPTDNYIPVYLDLLDSESIKKGINEIISKEGRIDILINNAGIGITGSIEETNLTDVKKVLAVQVEVAPNIRKQYILFLQV